MFLQDITTTDHQTNIHVSKLLHNIEIHIHVVVSLWHRNMRLVLITFTYIYHNYIYSLPRNSELKKLQSHYFIKISF